MNFKIESESTSVASTPSVTLLPGTLIALPEAYKNKSVTFFLHGKKIMCSPLSRVNKQNGSTQERKSEMLVQKPSTPKRKPAAQSSVAVNQLQQSTQCVHPSPIASMVSDTNTKSLLQVNCHGQVMRPSQVATSSSDVVSHPSIPVKQPRSVRISYPAVTWTLANNGCLGVGCSTVCPRRRFCRIVRPRPLRPAQENIFRFKTKATQTDHSCCYSWHRPVQLGDGKENIRVTNF
uniref:Uncharacterized protein n=1 Tax=Anopheles minimus TaxID=112268 RepID=A0A182WN61_9DIPT